MFFELFNLIGKLLSDISVNYYDLIYEDLN
jgi:hypothetical protein